MIYEGQIASAEVLSPELRDVFASRASLDAVFQPIVDLSKRQIAGFEALARLTVAGVAVPPNRFLPLLDADDRFGLFAMMVGRALEALCTTPGLPPESYVSVNVEVGLLLAPRFVDRLSAVLGRLGRAGAGLVLEILEGERIDDVDAMRVVLSDVRALGVLVALDDIGSAYASLLRIRDLPIDIIKLDQAFARGLHRRPGDLAFISSLAGLSRSLDKRLVVEGVETTEALDALSILGIELVQGYAVAKPMRASLLAQWLTSKTIPSRHRTPHSMLGAYASHLTVVETCRALVNQPLQVEWKASTADWRGCEIGRYFTDEGLHGSRCGRAHIRFHDVLSRYETDSDAWEAAAVEFRNELAALI